LAQIPKVTEAAEITTTSAMTAIRERDSDFVMQGAAETEAVAKAQTGRLARLVDRKHNG